MKKVALTTKPNTPQDIIREQENLENKISTLRLIKSELVKTNDKAEYTLDETQEIKVLLKMSAQREDSVSQYEKGKRFELAEKERKELEIIKEFLPTMPSEEDVQNYTKEVIEKYIAEQNVGFKPSMSDMGIIMKAVKEKYATANGKVVNQVLKSYM